ncbi:MAG: glycerol-3-phosphate dehydrogenase/oxidase [Verrucomicrobiota bacterium]|nr:glycerol-3-phosphate dehydrogenase/oxidase [Verrucomicrobiota bacterium]
MISCHVDHDLECLDRMVDAEPLDLLIVGGGINGASLAREAALRNWRVLLVEKGDFGAQTSSMTTKLAHGGLRYLENMDFGLVHESLLERARLVESAPHLVKPLQFLLPVFRGQAGRPGWQLRIGIQMYHWLAGSKDIGNPDHWSPERIAGQMPEFRQDGLRAGIGYFEAQMDDSRLVLESLLDAVQLGAVAIRDCMATGIDADGGDARTVSLKHARSGHSFQVRARCVVYTAGPWTDEVWRHFDPAHESVLVPSRGVHLVLNRPGPACGLAVIHPHDARLFFILPWHGKTLVGTTETAVAGPETAFEADDEEIDYLVEGYRYVFPGALDRGDVLSSFAGIRPLVRQPGRSAGETSRKDMIHMDPERVCFVAGGKYTTFRRVGERVAEAVAGVLGRKFQTGLSVGRRFPGAERAITLEEVQAALDERQAAPELASNLLARYGTRALEVARFHGQEPSMLEPLHPDHPETIGEAVFSRSYEWSRTPEDFLLRRTRLGLLVDRSARDKLKQKLIDRCGYTD